MGASNAGGLGKKRNSGRISGFAAYRSTLLSIVGVAKCKNNSRDERRQASSTRRGVCHLSLAQEDDKVFVTCLTFVIRRRRRGVKLPSPLVNPPFFCCRRTEPWKLTLTHTPDPIRPTRWGPDPNWPTNGSKQGGLWPRGICPGGLVGHRRRQFNRRQQNRI